MRRALLQDADSREICKCSGDALLIGWQRRTPSAEEVQSPDRLVAQPHRDREDRLKACLERFGRETRPSCVTCQIHHADRATESHRFQTRTALDTLQLKELEQPRRLA